MESLPGPQSPTERSRAPRSQGLDLRSLMRAYEREIIEAALAAAGGHQRRAAQALGVLPTTLHEKMKRLGLTGRDEPRLQEAS